MASPTAEDSGMSLIEQSDTPKEDPAPVQPEPSVETLLRHLLLRRRRLGREILLRRVGVWLWF